MITEDTGREYVDELCRRSFLQCLGSSGRNGQSVYTMHNVIHDMAVLVAGEECHAVTLGRSRRVPEHILHASLLCNESSSGPLTGDTEKAVLEPFFNAKGLRSLVLVGDSIHWFKQVPQRLSKDLCHLHTLDLSNTHLHELPNSIDELARLHYLALNNTKIKFLPGSICKLHNLQTLGLRNCYALQELPKKMRKLNNLRHLDLSFDLGEGACLISMPSGLGKLTGLQTLSRFVVGTKKNGGIEELKDLIHLFGHLCISNLHNVCSREEVINANLQAKPHLDSLELQWGNQNLRVNEDDEKEVLEHLQPPSNVKQVKIKGYRATKFPDWITSPSSSNIVIMKLSNCKKCQCLPPLGQLPLLKELLIEGMDGVVYVDKEFCGYGANRGFPSLEKLQFKSMLRLRSWTGVGEGELSSLRQLIIKDCFYLVELPSQLPAVEELEIELYPRLVDFERFSCFPKELNVCCITLLTMLPRYTSLTSLIITGFPTNDLPLELQDHATIECMEIRDCARLIFLPAKGLPTHLTHLAIKRCPRLKHLTEDLKYLSALQKLTFEECEQLEPPPIDGLPNSLKISINKCPSLKERFRVDVNIEGNISILIDDEPAIMEEFSLASTSGSVFFQVNGTQV
ncbi:putative disease resistance RPP13-like protein 1 [Acorus calamus]|uniref:Disease resistance RPP13-like protein 1 n=1 Tax=Acorus calamus TaxID=4465 RepID=A0AAV9EZP0_ACOCL|nr:putative disease resistance RPP13-like protein 1 [Acorus calamus]KAK1318963.1 putative disease resistance RPP13-like protein 1 [Acorus calamus]